MTVSSIGIPTDSEASAPRSTALAANAGQLVSLYSPNPYEGGSSVSHLNDNVYSEALYIMDAQTPPGLGPQVYTPLVGAA